MLALLSLNSTYALCAMWVAVYLLRSITEDESLIISSRQILSPMDLNLHKKNENS